MVNAIVQTDYPNTMVGFLIVSDFQGLHIIRSEINIPTAKASIELIPCSYSMNNRQTGIQVLEEDCWQVLSSQPMLKDTEHHAIRVMTDLIDQKPLYPGDVLTRGNQWLAIVYDLDNSPICQPEWITQALKRLLALTETHKIRSLTLPILGSTHGDLAWNKSLDLLLDALHQHEGTYLDRVTLLIEDIHLKKLRKYLVDRNRS